MDEASGKMGLVEKAKTVMTNPSAFFEKIKYEQGIKGAFVYLAIFSLIDLAIVSAGIILGFNQILSVFLGGLMIIFLILLYPATLLLTFLSVGFVHIFARLLKGRGNYAATYKALIYGNTPSYIFGWVPVLGVVFSIYSIYLNIKGLSKLHDVSMLRAAGILFMPVIAVIAITMTIAGFLAYWASSYLISSISSNTDTIADQTENSLLCSYGQLRITYCSYKSDLSQISLAVENTGQITYDGLTAIIFYKNSTIDEISLRINPEPGALAGTTIDGVSPDYTNILVGGKGCPKNNFAETTCQ